MVPLVFDGVVGVISPSGCELVSLSCVFKLSKCCCLDYFYFGYYSLLLKNSTGTPCDDLFELLWLSVGVRDAVAKYRCCWLLVVRILRSCCY